jgi:hypothetical protein
MWNTFLMGNLNSTNVDYNKKKELQSMIYICLPDLYDEQSM